MSSKFSFSSRKPRSGTEDAATLDSIGKDVPVPTVMPVDRDKLARELHLSNFVNAFYEYRDLQLCGTLKTVLIIGLAGGLDKEILKWKKYEVTTFDIDDTFNPDVLGSIHDLSVFPDGRFDAVIASHVLEHVPVPYLDRSLQELARVGRFCLVYLPVAGRHFQLRLKADIKATDRSFIFDCFNYLHKPDGITPRYHGGQHFWEIGMKGFRLSDTKQRLSKYFKVVSSYRNADWLPSYNFILESRRSDRMKA